MPLLRPIRAAAAALLVAGLVSACRDSTEPEVPVARIDFSAVPDTIGVGDSLQVPAYALDAGNGPYAGAPLAWTSRAPAVVAITAAGAARALATGDAWLVATATAPGQRAGTDSVRVRVEPLSRSLRLAVPRDSVAPFDTLTVSVNVFGLLGPPLDQAKLRYSSSDTLVAGVDSLSGKVRVLGDGDVTIRVTDGTRVATTVLRSYLLTIETGGVRLREISVGWAFACGLDVAGAAYCWGANNLGQLGRGTRNTGQAMLAFGPVLTSTRFSAISAGRGGACGLTLAGGVECWGTRVLTGLSAQLTLDQRTVPVAVSFPPGTGRIARIDVGTRGPLCAIDEAGANYCFGDNTYQGIGGTTPTVTELRPVPGSPAAGLQSIASGEVHGCGATATGTLWCWGNPGSWSMGGPTTFSAVVVGGVPAFRDVVAGYQTTCALAPNGTPWCGGIVGSIDDWTDFRPLAMLPGAAPLTRLEGGTEFTCGLAATGEALCWAHGHPLVLPITFRTPQPVPLSRRERFVDVGAGVSGVCGVTAEGVVRCLTFKYGFQ